MADDAEYSDKETTDPSKIHRSTFLFIFNVISARNVPKWILKKHRGAIPAWRAIGTRDRSHVRRWSDRTKLISCVPPFCRNKNGFILTAALSNWSDLFFTADLSQQNRSHHHCRSLTTELTSSVLFASPFLCTKPVPETFGKSRFCGTEGYNKVCSGSTSKLQRDKMKRENRGWPSGASAV